MADKLPEEQSRELINEQLKEKGWNKIDDKKGTGYVEEYSTSSGPVDYVLVVDGEILGLVEAKKSNTNSSAAFAQAENQRARPRHGSNSISASSGLQQA
jgi:type I restriction enzyme R subunit